MANPVKTRVLAKKGVKQKERAKKASGFDYPTQQVGVSTWLGSDGKPVTVYVDPGLGASGLSVAQYVLSKIDDVMRSCDVWFGVQGQGGNIIVAPDFGGAYHYGCDFSSGGDWYLSLSDKDTTVGLAMAEICESYMGLQGRGWNCGGSGGEALSRVLAEIATGGAGGAMLAYSAGPSWDGTNWIDADQGTDQDYPSIGCGVLYLWWLISQGHDVAAIVQAGESGGVLAGNYRTVTGDAATNAFTKFNGAVKAIGVPSSFQNDNPFNAPNPTYPPAGGGGGGGGGGKGGGLLTASGMLDFFNQQLPITLTGQVVPAGESGVRPAANWGQALIDFGAMTAALQAGDWAAAAAAFGRLLLDLGLQITGEQGDALGKALITEVQLLPLSCKQPPK